jgi:hypothetical protein
MQFINNRETALLSWFLLFISIVMILVVAACGKDCQKQTSQGDRLSFGTLEKIQCPMGQMVDSVTPKYLPGGQVVTHLEVQCVHVNYKCE